MTIMMPFLVWGFFPPLWASEAIFGQQALKMAKGPTMFSGLKSGSSV